MPAPIIPLLVLGAGALLALAAGKKKTSGTSATPGESGQAAGSAAYAASKSAERASVARGFQAEVLKALEGLNVDPNTYQITKVPDEAAIQYASGLVGRMKAAGFNVEASTLDKFVQDAIRMKPAPKVVTVPSIPESLQAQLNQVLVYNKDPVKLREVADALAKLPNAANDPTIKSTIEMLQQMALQIEAQQKTAEAMKKTDQILSAPTAPSVVLPQTPNATVSPVPASPITPSAVLANPQVNPTAAPKSPVEVAADLMVAHLKRLQLSSGSVVKAKGKEDVNIIKKFQTLARLTVDGKPGPGTLVAAASFGQYDLPLVMYWPTGAKVQKVYDYRTALETIATKLDSVNPAGAALLRASAAREKGQAGVIGGPLKG